MESGVIYRVHGYATSEEHITKCIDVVKIANRHHFYLDTHHFRALYPYNFSKVKPL